MLYKTTNLSTPPRGHHHCYHLSDNSTITLAKEKKKRSKHWLLDHNWQSILFSRFWTYADSGHQSFSPTSGDDEIYALEGRSRQPNGSRSFSLHTFTYSSSPSISCFFCKASWICLSKNHDILDSVDHWFQQTQKEQNATVMYSIDRRW